MSVTTFPVSKIQVWIPFVSFHIDETHHYLQRSTSLPPTHEVWGKVMFLHVSAILSKGGSTFPQCHRVGRPPRKTDPPRRQTPSDRRPPRRHPPPPSEGRRSFCGRYASFCHGMHSCYSKPFTFSYLANCFQSFQLNGVRLPVHLCHFLYVAFLCAIA